MLNEKQREFIHELCFVFTLYYFLDMFGYPEGELWFILSLLVGLFLYHILFYVKAKSDTEE